MIEILTIGDELTSGRTVDENSTCIARALNTAGLTVARITTVGDGIKDIQRCLHDLLEETRFVIVTGGLGPTEDDRTAQAAASAFGKKLLLSKPALDALEKKYTKFGGTMSPGAQKQALLPEGCCVIPNPVGTACGFLIAEPKQQFMFLPGVPEEVRAMLESFLIGHILKESGSREIILSKTLKVFGLWESGIHERLHGALPECSSVSLGYYPHYPEVSLKITGKGTDRTKIEKEIALYQQVIYENIGDYIYSESGESLEEVVGDMLKKCRETLAVAESCTGGLITHRLTNIAGSSEYVERSYVVYSNRAKEELLNIPCAVLSRYGAVSEPVAGLMATRARKLSGTTYGLAVTGIAGPGGGSTEKPVGTVFIGISSLMQTGVTQHRFRGSREKIKIMSSQVALNLLRNFMSKNHV
ncbi:MAG: competence/damage-inducible protein A [Pseudomonadota bacterium]